MDARLIGAVTPVDVVGSMSRGNALAQETNALRMQNDLANLYRTQGADIFAGNQGALNALAGIDPITAMDVQAKRQGIVYDQRRLEVLNAEEARAVETFKATKTAAEAQAAAAQIEDAVKMGMAIQTPEQWDAVMSQQAPDLVGQFANRDALAQKYMTMAEILKRNEPAKPADEYQRYVQEEQAAGRAPLARLEYEQAKKGKGMSFTTTNPDGSTTTFSMGGPAKDPNNPNVGEVYNPAAASDAVGLINDILGVNDQGQITPESRAAIDRITGTIEGGGGNDIDQMSAARRWWYRNDGVDKVEKLGQLQSKAWLAARDMLKGGGPITDYESRKAEAAVARLSRAKGAEELISALTELREAIETGAAKLQAARGQAPQAASQAPAQIQPPAGLTAEDLQYLEMP